MKAIEVISKKHGVKLILLDDKDFDKLSKVRWGVDTSQPGKFYACRRPKKEKGLKGYRYMHHELISVKPGFEVDHIDGNGLNNQRGNLRQVNRLKNSWNSKSRSGTSVFKGVSFDKSRGRWVASITCKGEQKMLGRFINEKDAAQTYNMAAKSLFGDYAKLNAI